MTEASALAARQTVSVVVPAWNAARFLAEAVTSALEQSYAVDEIMIVDDGSTDDSPAVSDQLAATNPRVRVIHQANAGPGAARDRGIAATHTDLVALLDADDRWHPDKIARQVALLTDRPNVDAVFTQAQNFFDGVPAAGPTAALTGYIPSAVLFRRTALQRTGGFDSPDPLSDWVPWFLRLRESCEIAIVPETLVERRVHDANRGRQEDSMAALARHVGDALRRRRGA